MIVVVVEWVSWIVGFGGFFLFIYLFIFMMVVGGGCRFAGLGRKRCEFVGREREREKHKGRIK